MGKRDKTRFERWFSMSQHKRRAGADNLSSLISSDFKSQKTQIISGNEVVYTHGSQQSLKEHFNAIKNEFVGQSELCHTHAKIIVLIRRDFKVKNNFQLFEQLWKQEKSFLLKNINTRWLASAADTFADYSHDDAIKGLSVACTCLLNTVKIQESERFLTNAEFYQDDKIKKTQIDNNQRFALFDGTSVFKFGTDDTLRNMRWRLNKAAKINIAGDILLEIFKRLQKFDTVYKRTKDRHTRDKTAWW